MKNLGGRPRAGTGIRWDLLEQEEWKKQDTQLARELGCKQPVVWNARRRHDKIFMERLKQEEIENKKRKTEEEK